MLSLRLQHLGAGLHDRGERMGTTKMQLARGARNLRGAPRPLRAPHGRRTLAPLGTRNDGVRRGVADVDESYLKEDTVTLGISFNGKTRFTLDFPADASKETIEKAALEAEQSQKYLDGMTVAR